jgi:hypothetical protein
VLRQSLMAVGIHGRECLLHGDQNAEREKMIYFKESYFIFVQNTIVRLIIPLNSKLID